MSTPFFPDLPGLGFGCTRSPIWHTLVQTAANGFSVRTPLSSYPQWAWELTFNYLRSAAAYGEMQSLASFFNSCAGGAFSFFFRDPDDHQVTGQFVANGDGSTKTFQLQRTWTYYSDPIFAVDTRGSATYGGYTRPAALTPQAYVGGTPTSATFGAETGLLTFASAPASGALITADFSYVWRVRFADDQIDLEDLFTAVYQLGKLRLIQERV